MKTNILGFIFGILLTSCTALFLIQNINKDNERLKIKNLKLKKDYCEVLKSSHKLDSLLNIYYVDKRNYINKRDSNFTIVSYNILKVNELSTFNVTEEDRKEALRWLDSL